MAKFIGVIGGSEASDELLKLAERVGSLIASEGCVLVCGGLGGVMEAAAKGAKSAGGLTVGVLPGGSRSDANPYIDIAIATNMGHARNAIIAHTCDALIAVGGRYGTLSEISFGLALGKRVVSLKSWDVDPGIIAAGTPEEAVSKAVE
ncbi:MAG TPA: TIGR00725 family protein [Firmicutes bacterium]|nr:TIGR00725 family protein [Bacillota bacterium]